MTFKFFKYTQQQGCNLLKTRRIFILRIIWSWKLLEAVKKADHQRSPKIESQLPLVENFGHFLQKGLREKVLFLLQASRPWDTERQQTNPVFSLKDWNFLEVDVKYRIPLLQGVWTGYLIIHRFHIPQGGILQVWVMIHNPAEAIDSPKENNTHNVLTLSQQHLKPCKQLSHETEHTRHKAKPSDANLCSLVLNVLHELDPSKKAPSNLLFSKIWCRVQH